MLYLYLLRHGKSAASESKEEKNSKESGKKGNKRRQKPNTRLGKTGKIHAAFGANKLPDDLDHLFCSPYDRARDTANIIGEKKDLWVNVRNDLREIDKPEFVHGASYKNPDHVEYMNQRTQIITVTHDLDAKYKKQGESHGELLSRTFLFKKWIEENYQGKKIAVVGHSNHLAMLITALVLGNEAKSENAKIIFNKFQKSFLDYGGLAILAYDETTGKWNLLFQEQKTSNYTPR